MDFGMRVNPEEYQTELRRWFSKWIQSQEGLRPRGWKGAFEKDAGMIKTYFYKLQTGEVQFDIENLTRIANQIGMQPSDILRQVEKNLLHKKT